MLRLSFVVFVVIGLTSCQGALPEEQQPDSQEPQTVEQDQPAEQNPPAAEYVHLDGWSIGRGIILVWPTGEPGFSGYFYPVDTEVALEAFADTDWTFVGWFSSGGDLVGENPTLTLRLTEDTFLFAIFEELAPPPPPHFFDAIVVADDGQFLGVISDDPFDPDSLANAYGTYGSEFSSTSIWNPYGRYGNDFGFYSAYNPYTSTPPSIFIEGAFVAYLSKNYMLMSAIDPDDVAVAIGRFDVVREYP